VRGLIEALGPFGSTRLVSKIAYTLKARFHAPYDAAITHRYRS
jgi:hypothetical protein